VCNLFCFGFFFPFITLISRDRERLRGKWGVAEVADAAHTVKELGERGLIDPARATIRGGSAGEDITATLSFQI